MSRLPSRFSIDCSVLAGHLDGGKPGVVTAVHFTKAKVSYDVAFDDGTRRKLNSERVHPGPNATESEIDGFTVYD
jgi:hypothetical protein